MARKTIDSSTVRRIAAEVDCNPKTVRNVFEQKQPSRFPISRRVYAVLIRDGYLDPVEAD